MYPICFGREGWKVCSLGVMLLFGVGEVRAQMTPQERVEQAAMKMERAKVYVVRRSEAPAETDTGGKAALKLANAGEYAVLTGADGKVLWRSAERKRPLYRVVPSPDGKRVVLCLEDGKCEIWRVEPFEKMLDLPVTAAVPRAVAFSDWCWLDDLRLVGASGVEVPPEKLKGLTAAEREEPIYEKMQIYIFRPDRQTLEPVKLGEGLPEVFEVLRWVEGGWGQVEVKAKEGGKAVGEDPAMFWVKVGVE